MTSAFVLNNETILCQETANGWIPLVIALPASILSDELPSYSPGCVALQANLASQKLNQWQLDANRIETDALATNAITLYYAQNHHIALPQFSDAVSLTKARNADNESFEPVANELNAFISYRQLLSQLPTALANQLSQAIQLLRWQGDTQFCSRCSHPVIPAIGDERAMVCSVCQLRQYPRVQPCVITAITRPNPVTGNTQVLLAHHHRYGETSLPLQYGLIAGFVEAGESLEHAVIREVAEEVGLSLTDISYVSSQPWPFPSNLMVGFRACYASGDIVLQEDELSHADFFDLANLPKIPFKGSIAYDLIAQIAHEQGVSL